MSLEKGWFEKWGANASIAICLVAVFSCILWLGYVGFCKEAAKAREYERRPPPTSWRIAHRCTKCGSDYTETPAICEACGCTTLSKQRQKVRYGALAFGGWQVTVLESHEAGQ